MKRKLSFYWLIMFVTMTTPIFSHVKDTCKNEMFTAHGEEIIFLLTGKILVFYQYLQLYNCNKNENYMHITPWLETG